MKKILFCVADYSDYRQQVFDQCYSVKNQQYADKHGFEYRVYKPINTGRESLIWNKFFIAKNIVQSELSDGDVLTVLDADMVIVDGSEPYETEKSFSYAVDNGNTHCMGSYTFRINSWSRNLIDRMTDESFYQKYKNVPKWMEWAEQAAWYYLTGLPHHSWDSFLSLDNYGWHTEDYGWDRFSIDELNEHVEVRGPEWNTTLLAEEAETPQEQMLQRYNIVRSQKKDTRIRHWAGGQRWRTDEFYSKEIV